MEFISEAPKPAASQMAADLAAGTVVYIAHVRKNSHFVLLTQAADKTAKRFRANDPYFNEKSYAYTDMSDVITYKVLPHVEPVACVDIRSPFATLRICSRTLLGCFVPLRRAACFVTPFYSSPLEERRSNASVTPRCGSLHVLLSVSADVRSLDGVVAFKGTLHLTNATRGGAQK